MTAFDWGPKINQQSILLFHISLTKYTLQGTKKFPSDEIMIKVYKLLSNCNCYNGASVQAKQGNH